MGDVVVPESIRSEMRELRRRIDQLSVRSGFGTTPTAQGDDFLIDNYYASSGNDWARALEAAALAAHNNGGGRVLCPKRRYTFTPRTVGTPGDGGTYWQGIVLQNLVGVHIVGVGKGDTVFEVDNAGIASNPSACFTGDQLAEFSVAGCTFTTKNRGNARAGASTFNLGNTTEFEIEEVEVTQATIYALRLAACSAGDVHHCHVHASLADGIHFQTLSTDVRVHHNYVEDCGDDLVGITSDGNNPNTNLWIDHNYLENGGTGGVSVHGGSNIHVEDNKITNVAAAGIGLGGAMAPGTDIYIRNNDINDVGFRNYGVGTSGYTFGIHATANSPDAFAQDNIVIEGNKLRNVRNGYIGIGDFTYLSNWRRIVIRNNQFYGPIVPGSKPGDPGSADPGSYHGVGIYRATDLVIVGNYFAGGPACAIFVKEITRDGSNNVATGCQGPVTIDGNQFENACSSGFPYPTTIAVGSGTTVHVCNNRQWGTLPANFLQFIGTEPGLTALQANATINNNELAGKGYYNCQPTIEPADPFVIKGKLVVVSGYPWLDVQKYAINLNGDVDATANLNQAIADAGAIGINGGGVLLLPPGRIRCDSTVVMAAHVRLRGAGMAATSIRSNAATALQFPGGAVESGLEDIKVETLGNSSSFIGILFSDNLYSVQLVRVHVINSVGRSAGQQGYRFAGGANAVKGCSLRDCKATNMDLAVVLVNVNVPQSTNNDAVSGIVIDNFYTYGAGTALTLDAAVDCDIRSFRSEATATKHVDAKNLTMRCKITATMLGNVIHYTFDAVTMDNWMHFGPQVPSSSGAGDYNLGTRNYITDMSY